MTGGTAQLPAEFHLRLPWAIRTMPTATYLELANCL